MVQVCALKTDLIWNLRRSHSHVIVLQTRLYWTWPIFSCSAYSKLTISDTSILAALPWYLQAEAQYHWKEDPLKLALHCMNDFAVAGTIAGHKIIFGRELRLFFEHMWHADIYWLIFGSYNQNYLRTKFLQCQNFALHLRLCALLQQLSKIYH